MISSGGGMPEFSVCARMVKSCLAKPSIFDRVGLRLMRLTTCLSSLATVILFSSCSVVNEVYDAVGPPAQLDHPLSEFGKVAGREVKKHEVLGIQKGTEFEIRYPKPLKPGKRTYLILQVDGGGILGITPSNLVARLEDAVQMRPGMSDAKLNDVLSICSGTSTGAIISGGIAAGIPAEDLAEFYHTTGYELFRGKGKLPLSPIFQFKFNREKFQNEMFNMLEKSDYHSTVRLGEMRNSPRLILAAYDLVGKRTLFFRNRVEIDSPENTADIQLVDSISASALSAAYYFGELSAPQIKVKQFLADGRGEVVEGAIFADGGQGTQNTTISLATREALKILKSDPESQVALISLGCGNDFASREYKEVAGFRGIDQLVDFLYHNQARRESILIQWLSSMQMEEIEDRLKVYRFDWNLTSEKDASPFSVNPKQREYLLRMADEIGEREDFRQLLSDLSDERIRIAQHRE